MILMEFIVAHTVIKSSKIVCYYEIEVSDDNENLVARISTTGYRKGHNP